MPLLGNLVGALLHLPFKVKFLNFISEEGSFLTLVCEVGWRKTMHSDDQLSSQKLTMISASTAMCSCFALAVLFSMLSQGKRLAVKVVSRQMRNLSMKACKFNQLNKYE